MIDLRDASFSVVTLINILQEKAEGEDGTARQVNPSYRITVEKDRVLVILYGYREGYGLKEARFYGPPELHLLEASLQEAHRLLLWNLGVPDRFGNYRRQDGSVFTSEDGYI